MESDVLKQLREQVDREYDRKIYPTAGKYLVRILGKETKYGEHIVLADGAGDAMQHKPVYEGIVLEKYESYTRNVRLGSEWKDIRFEPMIEVGSHVLFPHYEGLGTQNIRGDLRFIKEDEVIAVLEYVRKENEEPVARVVSGLRR